MFIAELKKRVITRQCQLRPRADAELVGLLSVIVFPIFCSIAWMILCK